MKQTLEHDILKLGDACCGCSACAQICPKSCIRMEADEEGFAYPKIDEAVCIRCGRCDRACPVLARRAEGGRSGQQTAAAAEDRSGQQAAAREDVYPRAVGGWIADDEIRARSSSGGAFTALAKRVIGRGGVVFGAAMGDDLVVRHIGVSREEKLDALRGSKYVESRIGTVYQEVRDLLAQGREVLFSGTPCQCAGLRAFLGKDDKALITVDFICHGVPSAKVFRSYLDQLEEDLGEKIISFRFRLKDHGWRATGQQLGTQIRTASGKMIRRYPAFADPFMNGFLDDAYLRRSCYQCAFKQMPKRESDITIADFWGVRGVDQKLDDGKGTSLLLIHSEKGERLFGELQETFVSRDCGYEEAIRRNQSLIRSAELPARRGRFFAAYRSKPFKRVQRKFMNPVAWASHKAPSILWNLFAGLVRKVMGALLGVAHIRWSEEQWAGFFQFVRFALVGVTNAAVSYLINVVTLLILHKTTSIWYDYIIANTTAFLLSVLWSYYWNSRKVFVEDEPGERSVILTLLKTYATYAFTGIVVNNILSSLWINVLHVSKFAAPLLNIPFTVPINFLVMKKWAYAKKK